MHPVFVFSEVGKSNNKQQQTEERACVDAVPGTFSPIRGEATPTPCPPGTWQNMTGSTSCNKCDFNTYNDKMGGDQEDACTPCPMDEQGVPKITKRNGEESPKACTQDVLTCNEGDHPIDGVCTSCLPGFIGNVQGTFKCSFLSLKRCSSKHLQLTSPFVSCMTFTRNKVLVVPTRILSTNGWTKRSV